MSNKESARCRSQVIPAAHGQVLEVGIGSGFNLPFYQPGKVTQVCGIDPSPELLKMARKKVNGLQFPVELLNQSAEQLSVGTETMDSVVITWTLCSIPDVLRALHEMRRVLKPEGGLIFVEHGLAPEPRLRSWQNRLNRPWWNHHVGEEKGAQPTSCPILRQADKERTKCRIEEAGKRADHDQDLKTNHKIQHDRTT